MEQILTFITENKALTVGLGLVVAYITTKMFSSGSSSSTKKEEKKEKETIVLNPKEYRKFKLKSRETLTSGEGVLPVVRYSFEIPNNQPLGLPTGKHIRLR